MKKILLLPLVALSLLVSCANKGIKIIHTDNAPEPIGPYSQAVVYNGLVYCSGQIGLDPKTQTLVTGGIESETAQALNNLKAVIEAAETNMDKMLKSTIYITDMENFNTVNSIYDTYFNEGHYPARAVVEVSALPKDALVEVEAVVAL